jgi:hypothetical protein
MSSISSISSGVSPYSTSGTNPFRKDMKSLETSLQSGDLKGAQSALTSLQADFQNAPKPPGGVTSTSGTGSSTSASNPIQSDLQAVQSAIQSGDTTGAQSAFAKLKTDLQSVKGHHGGHHHHGGGMPSVNSNSSTDDATQTTSSTSSTSTSGSTSTDPLTTLLDALQSAAGSNSSAGTTSVNQFA